MAKTHGKNTVIIVNGVDISLNTDNSDLTLGADEHDITGYGLNDHVVAGGLGTGAATMGGAYDTSLTAGPRAVLEPLVGQVVQLIRRPEGTGSGKPQDKLNVHIKEYKETNPVADYVRWTCSMTKSGANDATPQP